MQNPVMLVDPDGRDGIRIIDKKNKTITIKANYYLQTDPRPKRNKRGKFIEGYSAKQMQRIQNRTNKWLNKQKLTVNKGEFEGYTLVFDITLKEGGNVGAAKSKADNDKIEEYDIGNTISRASLDEIPEFEPDVHADGRVFQENGTTIEKKYITMNVDGGDKKMNQIHEIFHTLGLSHESGGASEGVMHYPPENLSQNEVNQLGNDDFLPVIIKTEP